MALIERDGTGAVRLVTASPGEVFYGQARVKMVGAPELPLRVGFQERDSSEVYLRSTWHNIEPSVADEWVIYDYSITVLAATAAYITPAAGIAAGGSGGEYYLDSLYLERGVPAGNRINLAALEAARAYCAAKGWTGGYWIDDDMDFVSNLSLILAGFRGDIIGSAGTFRMMFRDLNYEDSVMDLTEEDVVINDDGTTTLQMSPRNRWRAMTNTLQITHYSSALNYQENTYTYQPEAAIADDNGNVRPRRVDLLGLNTTDKLQAMGAYLVERDRWGLAGSLAAARRVLVLEPGDPITLSHTLPGYTVQPMRLTGMSHNGKDPVINIEEDDIDLYDDDFNLSELEIFVPETIDLTDDPPSVANITIAEETRATRLRTGTWLLVDFDPPENYPFFRGARVWLRIGATGDWRYMTEVDGDYEYGPVQEDVEYFFKLQSVNTLGKTEDFDNAPVVSQSVMGMDATPGNLTNLSVTVSGSVIIVTATGIDDDDLIGYEIRMGTTWDTSAFLVMLVPDQPIARIPGITPGEQTIWIAAKNNAGKYSSAPTSYTVTIPYPTNWTYQSQFVWDFDGIGTHSNTEHTTYDFGAGSVDALKCSHTSDVLSGTWTSPTIDMGSVKRARIIGEFISDLVEGDKTWGSLFPAGTPWTDTISEGVSWTHIWNVIYRSSVEVSLEYGDAAVDENSFDGFVTSYWEGDCRYYRIKITITDPELTANTYVQQVSMTQDTFE